MRRTRLALLLSLVWLFAAALACYAVAWLGATFWGYALAGMAMASGLSAGLWIGRTAEARFAEKLGQLGNAVGLAGGETQSVEAIVECGNAQCCEPDVVENSQVPTQDQFVLVLREQSHPVGRRVASLIRVLLVAAFL